MARLTESVLVVGMLFTGCVQAGESAQVEFSAQISDGSCEMTLSDTSLMYGVHRRTDIQGMSTVMLQPLTAAIRCSGATTPSLSVTGTPYPGFLASRPVVFRDAASEATGVGFMIRRDMGGINDSNFYDESEALANGESVLLSPVGESVWQSEVFLLGLVHAGNEVVTPGVIRATLTFTVSYE